MPKSLTSQQVKALVDDGRHYVDRNLYLQVVKEGATRSWLFRYKANGKTRWMGLGSARDVTLSEARGAADDARRLLRQRIDPIAQRRADQRPTSISFEEATEAYIKAHAAGWSSPKHSHQVRAHLTTYAYPRIGKLPCDQIDANHIVRILEPIWTTKNETATRVRGRIEMVLDWAKSAGYRAGDNPAAWKAGLQFRLPPSSRVQSVEHHVAIPHADAPAVYQRLRAVDSTVTKAMAFLALTAVRYGEAIKATWSEFDLDAAVPVWTVPAARMKGRVTHYVPLSAPAVDLLRSLRPADGRPDQLVFHGTRLHTPVSDVAVRKALRKVSTPDADIHGWRSTFRDWAAEKTTFPGEVAEAALAHSLGSKVEVAYLRTDFFDQRVQLMEIWGLHLTASPSAC